MAGVTSEMTFSRAAKVALSANTFVTIDSSTTEGKLVQTGAAGLIAGVLLYDTDIDEPGAVAFSGTVKVAGGAAIVRSSPVFSDANGKAVDSGAGNRIGKALNSTSGADELIEVLIQRGAAP